MSAHLLPPFPQSPRILAVVEHGNDNDLLTLDEVVDTIGFEAANCRTPNVSETLAVPKRVLDNHRNRVIHPVEELKSESGFLLFVPRGRCVGFNSGLRKLFERVRHAVAPGCGRSCRSKAPKLPDAPWRIPRGGATPSSARPSTVPPTHPHQRIHRGLGADKLQTTR